MSRRTPFTEAVIKIIKSIPRGEVLSYGEIAVLAGNPRGARQVSRILHSCSSKEKLPWHRVINSKGCISLKGDGFEIQKQLLEKEGFKITKSGKVEKE